ncbi:MAG TPA: hypothetical protein VFM55_01215 [Micromonosporaceae bacterium]|nr:hypothetical protein [Micromonosporaceae bacterium]
MTGTPWGQILSIGLAAVGAVTGIGSLVFTVKSHRLNARDIAEARAKTDQALATADSTDQSIARLTDEIAAARKIAAESVGISRAAANSASRSADEAARMSSIEVEREHRGLAPALTKWEVKLESTGVAGLSSLTGLIEVQRDYRVRAFGIQGNRSWWLSLPLVLKANRAYSFEGREMAEGAGRTRGGRGLAQVLATG